jgi:hypothetical protein
MRSTKAEFVKRHAALKERMRLGEITDLALEPKWSCVVAGVTIAVVEAEFSYRLVQRGTQVAEFVNPSNSAIHSVRKKLLKACHGIESQEVRA